MNAVIKKVGLYAKKSHPDAAQLAAEIRERLQKEQIEVLMEDSLAEQVGQVCGYAEAEIPALVDLVIVLGGDGTLISVARLIGDMPIPILGVNLGSLGFLTEVTRHELSDSLDRVIKGEFEVSDRMMLDAVIRRNGEVVIAHTVLNDVVINKGALARIIDMETSVDDAHLTTFKADGLIIATPTGSTGYNLAAGGPIIYPGINSLVITPICPHMLTNRPIIVSDQARIQIEVKFDDDVVFFTADGQVGCKLLPNDIIEVRKSASRTLLIASPRRDYFEILRTKLSWGAR
ncbi:MAG: NAD(+) kinase [Desulfuromonas sp.]|nr:MAG: NAD(+) kinase [Desulfuromonas sp.]